MSVKRIAIGALSLSAAAFGSLVAHEWYTGTAVIPTAGDRPTVGFGSTFREDGSPVQLGDTITPPKAIARSLAHIQRDESGIKECVTAELHQAEYDLMVDFAYQYGVSTLCASSIARLANAGDYVGSCEAYARYKYQAKRDCSLPRNWGPRGCKGVWTRSLERREKCLSAAATATVDKGETGRRGDL